MSLFSIISLRTLLQHSEVSKIKEGIHQIHLAGVDEDDVFSLLDFTWQKIGVLSAAIDMVSPLITHLRRQGYAQPAYVAIWALGVLNSLPTSHTQHLSVLSIENEGLSSLPENIGELSQLVHINISRNILSALPSSMKQLTGLQKLQLDDNNFTEIPSVIRNLKKIHSLSFANNKLTDIPNFISELSSLKNFDITGNLTVQYLSAKPLERLLSFSITGNDITYHNTVKVDAQLAGRLNFLKLQCLCDDIPETRIRMLTTLNLQDQELEQLPDSFSRLRHLRRLNLHGNQLQRLPSSLTELFKEFDLVEGTCFFTTEIKVADELRGLLNSLKLEALCSYIDSQKIMACTRLDLSNQSLRKLPDSIDVLCNLEELDLRGNELNDLPKSFVELTKLQKLYLDDKFCPASHSGPILLSLFDPSVFPRAPKHLVELYYNRSILEEKLDRIESKMQRHYHHKYHRPAELSPEILLQEQARMERLDQFLGTCQSFNRSVQNLNKILQDPYSEEEILFQEAWIAKLQPYIDHFFHYDHLVLSWISLPVSEEDAIKFIRWAKTDKEKNNRSRRNKVLWMSGGIATIIGLMKILL